MVEATASPSSENGSDATARMSVYGFLMDDSGFGDMSPFVTKLLTFLKMTKADYKYIDVNEHLFVGSPKGKMPWIHAPELFGENKVGDSSTILRRLVEADPAKYDLDTHLSAEDKAIGWALKTMMEESLYFSILHVRWYTEEGKGITIPTYFRDFHWSIQKVAGWYQCRIMYRQLMGQGTGKLTDEEITSKAKAEIQSLSVFLGQKKYLMGDKISSFDATFFAFLVGNIKGEWNHPICQATRDYQNLVDYVERMLKEFWS